MDQKKLDQQSQHWEVNFSNKPEMFGLNPSLSAKKALKLFQEKKIQNIVEIGAGLGRDTIFFAKNSIHIIALDYSFSGIKVINQKTNKDNLSNYISTKHFDVRQKLPFNDIQLKVLPRFVDPNTSSIEGGLLAPMPGKISEVLIKKDQKVKAGQSLMIIEAMKMEQTIKSPNAGKISKIMVKKGQQVENGESLLVIDE